MMQDIQKIRSVFGEALEKKTKREREAYLTHVCGNDPGMRAEVDALLRMQPDADEFFKDPIVDIDVSKSDLTETPGTVIGRYKLLEKIGEGGMAVVYMAEQTEPIRRKVALKIIKLGMDTKSIIARFEAERQALAMMDHPNIAKVLDAGATETGRPYFVMELVTGVSITEYCDKNSLSTKERLALFIKVCNAVQHAHQKGIIHRDIKPANVMVTRHEGKPIPKVIDFGIAKATNQRLTEKTLFTRYAHIIGTPAYMSPEQAELSDLGNDTRTDIYSLGVLLYELLTGTTPFSEKELRKAGYIEMQRVIREQQPPKPSTKLSTLGETLTDIAKYHGCTPDLLTKSIRGDLDWIVMKALEKTRERRYDNASALAMDVQRHLYNEPVLARAPSIIYRLDKFLRRHRIESTAVLIVVVLVVVMVSVISTWRHKQRQLDMEVSVRHNMTLYQAKSSLDQGDFATALMEIESILKSEYVGPQAQALYDRILAHVRRYIVYYTDKIKADPENANNYFRRAKYFDCLGEREKATADMTKYSTILDRKWKSDYRFGIPENLGSSVNSPLTDWFPKISSDSLSLTFIRAVGNFAMGEAWMTTRSTIADPWSIAVKLGRLVDGCPPPIESLKATPGLTTADGLEVYFWASAPDEPGNSDIWAMMRETIDAPWNSHIHIGPPVSGPGDELNPCISPDGLELYFSDSGINPPHPGGYGHSDIWVTRRAARSDHWAEPVNLGPIINNATQDARPSISPDGLMLFFDSDRPGGYGRGDLYMTRRSTLSDSWSEPVNLGPHVNSAAHDINAQVSPDGSTLYFCSDRPGGYGRYDLWQASIIAIGSSPNQVDHKNMSRKQLEINLEKEVVP